MSQSSADQRFLTAAYLTVVTLLGGGLLLALYVAGRALRTTPTGDLIVALIGVAVIVSLAPLAVHGLLDLWGDRHPRARRALVLAAVTAPIIATAAGL